MNYMNYYTKNQSWNPLYPGQQPHWWSQAFPEPLLTHKRLAWVALGANPMAEEALTRQGRGNTSAIAS
jgi:hypothetical protein